MIENYKSKRHLSIIEEITDCFDNQSTISSDTIYNIDTNSIDYSIRNTIDIDNNNIFLQDIDKKFWNLVAIKNNDNTLNNKTKKELNKYFNIALNIKNTSSCFNFKKNKMSQLDAKLNFIRVYELFLNNKHI